LKDEEKTSPEFRETKPAALKVTAGTPPAPHLSLFIKIEKNLASLGFFTPSSKRIKGTKKKTITFERVIGERKVEARATILPSAEYGLPITADQDKFFALQKIVSDIRKRQGEVRNPIGFTSAELLRILGRRVTAGKNYDDITEWLKRMTLTGISSEGTVYFAGKKIWATDTFHVFERSVSLGTEMPDGRVAEKNYVWLSEWQLENINNNHLMPVDLDTYRQLKNHIAKTMLPLLQIWLWTTRDSGQFEKSYDELCQMLNISRYKHISKIHEKLSPSLNELKACGYLADWKIYKDSASGTYKVLFFHGDRIRNGEAIPPGVAMDESELLQTVVVQDTSTVKKVGGAKTEPVPAEKNLKSARQRKTPTI
jgi:hypothetical protein